MTQGVGWGYNRGNCLYIFLHRKNISNIFYSRTLAPNELKLT
jgi:hypothetical protein